jgi:hypothetical protein
MTKKRNILYFNKKVLLVGLVLIILLILVGLYFKGITGNALLANYLDTDYAPPYNLDNSDNLIFTISSDSLVAVDDLANLTTSVYVDGGYIYQKGYIYNQYLKRWEVFNFEQTPVENSYWIKDFASKDLVINVSNRVVNNGETYIVAYACQKDSNGKWQCGCRSEGEANCKRWMFHTFEITNITVSPDIKCTDNINCSMTHGNCVNGLCVSKIVFSGLGSGTLADPYQITNWTTLNDVRYNLSAHYILMNDLDENSANYSDYAGPNANRGAGWKPIGNCGPNSECNFWNYDYTFRGTFNGNGYSINNLNINNFEGQYLGLFGYIYSSNISNLSINGDLMGSSYVGGIAGYMDSSSITNSFSSVNINEGLGSFQFGGIAGFVYSSTIINSSSSATITGGDNSNYLGGIAGYLYSSSSIINSSSSATITAGAGSNYLGGICSRLGASSSIINSSSSATITGGDSSLYLAGLVGNMYSSTIINSSSSATITGGDNSNYLGGIVGDVYGSSTIINSSSSATITGGDSSAYLGGIVGSIYSSSSIINSSSSATITGGAGSNKVGGIAGYLYSSSIINSSSSATLMGGAASNQFGGIAGYIDTASITNSYVSISDSQTLSCTSNLGLIVGQYYLGTITSTFGTIYDLQFGNITFLHWNVTRSNGGNLTNLIYLTSNYVNISMATSPANITLLGTPLSGSKIYRKTGLCGSYCYNFTPLNLGIVKFNITGIGGNYYIV